MLALTLSRQSVKDEDNVTQNQVNYYVMQIYKPFKALFWQSLLDPLINRHEVLRNEPQ